MKLKIKIEHLEIPTEDWISKMDGYSNDYGGAEEYVCEEGYCMINVNKKGIVESARTPSNILHAMIPEFLLEGRSCRSSSDSENRGISKTNLALIASNPNASKETLYILSKHHYEKTREAVAKNPNTPSEALDLLSDNLESSVRNKIPLNKNVSIQTLNKLTKDNNKTVRLRAENSLNEMLKNHPIDKAFPDIEIEKLDYSMEDEVKEIE